MYRVLERTVPTHRTEPLVVAHRASAGVPKEFFLSVSCSICGKDVVNTSKNARKYCSGECSKTASTIAASLDQQRRYEEFISKWKRGEVTGMKGKESISSHIRRYLFEKFDSKCCECGWSKVNPTSGKIPLEVEHVDGNWKNNKEENLKLLCPCCHSLTPTYRSLNKGKGRIVRLHKIEEKSREA